MIREYLADIAHASPYVKGLPIVATITSTNAKGDHSVEVIRPTYEDAYTLEYAELYKCITVGVPVKTSAEDGECLVGSPNKQLRRTSNCSTWL